MTERIDSGGVRGTLHRETPGHTPNGDAIVLTHGAGSDSNAKLLVRLAEEFAGRGYLVLRYDLPFRQRGGNPFPATAALDREGIAQAVEVVRGIVKGRIFAGGHSYGGRQTTMAAAERKELADGLLLLSYPLHPPKRPDQLRTAHFPQLATPSLFVHGNRDPFGTLEELKGALALVPARTDLLPVERAGHDLARAGDLAGEMLAHLTALL